MLIGKNEGIKDSSVYTEIRHRAVLQAGGARDPKAKQKKKMRIIQSTTGTDYPYDLKVIEGAVLLQESVDYRDKLDEGEAHLPDQGEARGGGQGEAPRGLGGREEGALQRHCHRRRQIRERAPHALLDAWGSELPEEERGGAGSPWRTPARGRRGRSARRTGSSRSGTTSTCSEGRGSGPWCNPAVL